MNDILQPGHHPDADQLSAFAEHALPPHEQQQMFAHLAVCLDCRALVYLVQQANPIEAHQSHVAAARRPWSSGWLSGWGLAIPATAIACLILLTLYIHKTPTPRNQTTTTTTAAIRQAQPPHPASPSKSVAPTSPVKVPTKSIHTSRQKNQLPIATDQMTATASVATAAPVAPTPIASAPAAQEAQVTPQRPQNEEMVMRTTAMSGTLSGGGITGTVVDPDGKVIVKAQVTATNTDTGVANTTLTTSQGLYAFNDLPVGTYNVDVVAKGFQRLLQENVNVDNASMFALNLKTTVGGENTTITIADAPPYLDTTDGTLGGTIEKELYTSLPLSMNGGPRNPTAFQYQTLGVQENPANATNQASTAGASGIYGGTGQTNLNQNYVEGVPISNIAAQGSGAVVTTAVPSSAVDALSTGTSAAGLANRKPLPTLPSKLPARSVVDNASCTLALDTVGALFRSDDAGVTWFPVSVQWQGHALSLRVTQPQTPAQQAATINAPSAAVARQQQQTLASQALAFELTTDSGAVYTSSDGQTWQRK